MPLTTEQELRRELVLFSLRKCPDFEAALKLARQIEQFILHGEPSDSGSSTEADAGGSGQAAATSTAFGRSARGEAPPLQTSGLSARGGSDGVQKRRWSALDDDVLTQRWHSAEPLETIALEMERTIPSLYCRARALGLGKRNAASKKSSKPSAPSAPLQEAAAPEPTETVPTPAAAGRKSEAPKCTDGFKRSGGIKTVVKQHASVRFGPPPEAELGDESIEQIIHFLRSRDYSITRVEDGRFKVDGRRILTEDELREKAHQVRQMLGQGTVGMRALQPFN